MSTRVEHALEKLKSTGVRMTPQRHAILTYLVESKSHPTADEIYRALEDQFPSMSVATVYNNLKVFVETGLVREMTYGDASSRYDADMHEHYHAICVSCGKIADFEHDPVLSVEEAAVRATGYQIQGHRLEVYGVCPDCTKTVTH